MYNFILALHNIFRWVVVITALYALLRSFSGFLGNNPWTNADRKAGMFFSMSMDVQFLVGLVLYFIFSPLSKQFLANVGDAMSNSELRFFGMEHVLLMLVAVVLAHIGNAAGKKDIPDKGKFKRTALFVTLAVIVLVLGIPWGRPLLPGF